MTRRRAVLPSAPSSPEYGGGVALLERETQKKTDAHGYRGPALLSPPVRSPAGEAVGRQSTERAASIPNARMANA